MSVEQFDNSSDSGGRRPRRWLYAVVGIVVSAGLSTGMEVGAEQVLAGSVGQCSDSSVVAPSPPSAPLMTL